MGAGSSREVQVGQYGEPAEEHHLFRELAAVARVCARRGEAYRNVSDRRHGPAVCTKCAAHVSTQRFSACGPERS